VSIPMRATTTTNDPPASTHLHFWPLSATICTVALV
jgi:hypothetical protein